MSARDPYLDIPLEGVRRIEASAGTGKTYTLATLVTRLVVERGLRLGQILAVTFTEAATQELRKRIRERLQLTLDLIDAPPADEDSDEAKLTRELLRQHRAGSGEGDAALRQRLRQAVLEIDLAAIFTIHGFCARVLREHALESGQGFDAPELLANARDLHEEVAADLWRAHAIDDDAAGDLSALWSQGYVALAKDLPVLLREPVLLPPECAGDDGIDTAQSRLAEAGNALSAAWLVHGDAFVEALSAAIDANVMNRNSYKCEWLVELRAWLQDFAGNGAHAGEVHAKLVKLTDDELAKGTKKDHKARTPSSPMTSTVSAYLDARAALDVALVRRRASLLHCIRNDARERMAALKRQRRVHDYDDMIAGVADALDGRQGDALVRRLRAQYAVALVDEFQDTDARQWHIFERVFGGTGDAPALFLIGDPKQAIYGFRGGDVHAYLAAGKVAQDAPPLAHNFRSRPAVLAAIAALYANVGNMLSATPRVEFHRVEPGGKRANVDFLRAGQPATALTVWQAPATGEFDKKGEPTAWSAGESRDFATRACVAAIHALLVDARAGKATLKDKDGMRPVLPGDIAVLVRSHREASQIQQALAGVGIPAVAAGKQGLFATREARELHTLLLALLHGGDDGRLRAALGTVLVGEDAIAIEALDRDGNAHRGWQLQAQQWRDRLRCGGPLALVGDLCARAAERLLGLLDGERRLSNYLQLAELLQEAEQDALGLHGLVDWLEHRIAAADHDDETQLLRLESDARRVQIVTLHKSKGLEYPLVFLPFAGIGSKTPMQKPGKRAVTNSGGGRILHWPVDTASDEWKEVNREWLRDQEAEDARLLYVGLTRAEHALWIATGPFYNHDKTALARMLGDADALARVDGIVFDAGLPSLDLPRLPPENAVEVPPARKVERHPANDWWVYSFSQLAKADAGDASSASTLPASGGNDEPDAVDDAVDDGYDPRFAGNRYGVALHAAFEHADFAAWRDWHAGDAAPAGETGIIASALRDEGYGAEVLDDGIALTTRLVGNTLTVDLPEGVRLCDVPADQRRPEIEFQFALQPVRVDAMLELLHAHGVVRDRHGFGLRQRLEGLMTGLIDLTYCVDGKWYVLDYKSNRLPAYDGTALQRAMAHSEYDLQALIYTLALHRWLRFRLGAVYDYDRDFGGIRYLFCRGIDAARGDSPGILAQRFAPELVHALDALFGHAPAGAAA